MNSFYKYPYVYHESMSSLRHKEHTVLGYDYVSRLGLRRTGYTSVCLVYGDSDRLHRIHHIVYDVDHAHTSVCPYSPHSIHVVVNDHIVRCPHTGDSDFGVVCARREILRYHTHDNGYVGAHAHTCSLRRILHSIASLSHGRSRNYPYRVYNHYESSGAHKSRRLRIRRNSMDICHARIFYAGRASWAGLQ